MIQQATGLLRLEVQCHKPKLDYLKNQNPDWDGRWIGYYLSERIAYDILETAVLRVTKDADFWKKNKAISMVEQADLTESMKEKLKKLINDVAISSIPVVREKYLKDGMNGATFSGYLALLEKNNINVCTIPRDHHISHLDSVWKLLLRGFREEQDL